MKRIGMHRLIERLTTNAMMESYLGSSNRATGEKTRPLGKSDMPGYRIKQLSPEERQTLTKATAKDFSWRGFSNERKNYE